MINKDIVYSTLLQIWSHFISFVCSGNVSRNGKTSECSSTIFIAVLMAGITNLNWAYTLMYFPLNEPTLRYWKLSLSLSLTWIMRSKIFGAAAMTWFYYWPNSNEPKIIQRLFIAMVYAVKLSAHSVKHTGEKFRKLKNGSKHLAKQLRRSMCLIIWSIRCAFLSCGCAWCMCRFMCASIYNARCKKK